MRSLKQKHILLGLILGISLPGRAFAQERDVAISDRIEEQLDRQIEAELSDALARSGRRAGESATVTTFSLSSPAYWTNNADYADEGGRSDFHINPTANLGVRHETAAGLVLDGRVTASSDQYVEHEDISGSYLALRMQASLKNAVGNFTPFLRYQPRLTFGHGEFGGDSTALHDISIGGSMPLGSSPTVKTKLDIIATRRESDSVASERWQTGGTLTLSGDITTDRLAWSVSQSAQGRFFTGGANDGREDFYALTSAGLTMPLGENLEFTPLEVSLEFNESSRVGRDYVVLNVGISVTMSFSRP